MEQATRKAKKKKNIARKKAAWRRKRREVAAARDSANEERAHVAASSAQSQRKRARELSLKRKRSPCERASPLDRESHTAALPDATSSKTRPRQSCTSADGIATCGPPSKLEGLDLTASTEVGSSLPLTPQSIVELDSEYVPTVGLTSPESESGDGLSLDDRLLSVTPEPEGPRSLYVDNLPSTRDTGHGIPDDDEQPTELITAELSQIASQRLIEAEGGAESFLPPDSTALWIAAPSQVERAEQSVPQHPVKAEDEESFLPPDSTAWWIAASSQVGRAEQSFSNPVARPVSHPEHVKAEQTLPTPLTSFEQPVEPSMLPRFQLRWRSEIVDVPLDADRIYAVRRGRKPGFYFTFEGKRGAQIQTSDFEDCLYQWYMVDDTGLRDACEFLNHEPDECRHRCQPQCRKLEFEYSNLKAGLAHFTLPNEDNLLESRHCAACHVAVGCKSAILCRTCALTPTCDPALDMCIKQANLCAEQADVLRLTAQGHNIFYTGAAGTGKSTVLVAIKDYLRAHRRRVEVISPTGITALNVGGTTIHSFAAWGVTVDERPASIIRRDAGRRKVWKKLRKLEVLIIDEISMVSSNTMSRLNSVLQHVMHKDRPFGGVQVVITGDFYQLPPVKPFHKCLECGLSTHWRKQKPKEWTCSEHGIYHDDDKWAFCSQSWDDLKLRCKQLVQIHRQSDPVFTSLLNKYRVGAELTTAEEDLLWNHDNNTDGTAIRIFPRRNTVNAINAAELRNLESPEYALRCVDSYRWNENKDDYSCYDLANRWARVHYGDGLSPFVTFTDHRYDETLRFKVGMPVVLLTNIHKEHGLVNGSQGRLVGFRPYEVDKLPRAQRREDEESNLHQWIFYGDHGQYQEAEVLKFCERALASGKLAPPLKRFWPVVEYKNGKTCTIFPYCEVHEIGSDEPYSLMSRTQIPLLAAWSITTHKSQGMTLDQAEIDMSDAWEYGQTYTAMSRVRTLEGLKVSGMASGKACRADAIIQQFMDETTWVRGAG